MSNLEAREQRVLEKLAYLCSLQSERMHSVNGDPVDHVGVMVLLNALNTGNSFMTRTVLDKILNSLGQRGYLDNSQRNQVRILPKGILAIRSPHQNGSQ